jgi:hypothetical protein
MSTTQPAFLGRDPRAAQRFVRPDPRSVLPPTAGIERGVEHERHTALEHDPPHGAGRQHLLGEVPESAPAALAQVISGSTPSVRPPPVPSGRLADATRRGLTQSDGGWRHVTTCSDGRDGRSAAAPAAPPFAADALRGAEAATLDVVKSPGGVAIDRDRLGRPGGRARHVDPRRIWQRPLHCSVDGGGPALGLLW